MMYIARFLQLFPVMYITYYSYLLENHVQEY